MTAQLVTTLIVSATSSQEILSIPPQIKKMKRSLTSRDGRSCRFRRPPEPRLRRRCQGPNRYRSLPSMSHRVDVFRAHAARGTHLTGRDLSWQSQLLGCPQDCHARYLRRAGAHRPRDGTRHTSIMSVDCVPMGGPRVKPLESDYLCGYVLHHPQRHIENALPVPCLASGAFGALSAAMFRSHMGHHPAHDSIGLGVGGP